MLSASDNLSAEMVLRELGAHDGTATTAAGVQHVLAEMKKLGVDMAGAHVIDGSGLSHDDRLTCQTLMAVLALTDRPQFAAIRDGLTIAATRGTLATRFQGTPLAGNLRAKTGTLTGVSGLAGFVTADRPLTFALLLNGAFGQATGFARREAMATAIAGFPQTAGGGELVPAPNAPIPPRACPRGERAC
jgi:D-alanyl-D-alanine carboxypeptidase/D-alanyl-D-alanine-endopeptidase (penicillin-binding protein 4)